MKKVVLSLATILFLGVTAVNAQDAVKKETTTSKVVKQEQNEKKEAVNQDQLPAAIQTKLASDEFKDWKVASAHKVNDTYVIEVTNGDKKATHKFDKEGNKVG